VIDKLRGPLLTEKQLTFCKWAVTGSGGGAIVGKSWGKLEKNDIRRFDELNCNNAVPPGLPPKNPTCDETWGDVQMTHWLSNPTTELACGNKKSGGGGSAVKCYHNGALETYCRIDNAMIDFSKYKDIFRSNSRNSDTKTFKQGFLSADCGGLPKKTVKSNKVFSFPHLYSAEVSKQKCDYVYNGTLLMYSHDDLTNLGMIHLTLFACFSYFVTHFRLYATHFLTANYFICGYSFSFCYSLSAAH
jgi:hypothetical protein